MPPRKRRLDEIADLREPLFSDEQRRQFEHGIELFNGGRHWHAHEAWEEVWLAMGNDPADDAEIVLRGLIQLAAGLHLREIGRLDGMLSNFGKARAKLAVAGDRFLRLDIQRLLTFLDHRLADPDPFPDAPCTITVLSTSYPFREDHGRESTEETGR